jgi:hypothetical protein
LFEYRALIFSAIFIMISFNITLGVCGLDSNRTGQCGWRVAVNAEMKPRDLGARDVQLILHSSAIQAREPLLSSSVYEHLQGVGQTKIP